MKLDTPTYTLKNICPLAYLIPACDISQKTQRKNDVPEYVIDHGILNYTSFFNLLQTIKVDVIIYYNANGLRFFCISSMQSYYFYNIVFEKPPWGKSIKYVVMLLLLLNKMWSTKVFVLSC